jgi:hypothetical protein
MSWETIALIGVLTLFTVSLGSDLFWLIIVQPALQKSDVQAVIEVMEHINHMSARFMPIVFTITLLCAIALNILPHSRSEPYLLRIGLASLILYLILKPFGITHLWLSILSALVSYWSFLHYALNPKV